LFCVVAQSSGTRSRDGAAAHRIRGNVVGAVSEERGPGSQSRACPVSLAGHQRILDELREQTLILRRLDANLKLLLDALAPSLARFSDRVSESNIIDQVK
jgi:hypothetical protein